eukprot:TRINITY_DN15776_c0_g1_i1.p1 TRINITY_DN15776_c0_g1~~TRINITY_DN15776_c0_g1_i1.p1  ORF type:complete len:103 (-),score=24.93 TRINITY_DN15776_c0_g1_i1:132-440(-)
MCIRDRYQRRVHGEKTLMSNRVMLQEREEQLREAEYKYDVACTETGQVKTLLENGKKQFREYQQQYEALKARLEGNSQAHAKQELKQKSNLFISQYLSLIHI